MTLKITLWINLSGQIKSVRGCQIRISRSDGQDKASVLRNELHQHVSNLLLDVRRLITNRDLRQTGQVD